MAFPVLPTSEPALHRLQPVSRTRLPVFKAEGPPETPTPHASRTSKGGGCFLVPGWEREPASYLSSNLQNYGGSPGLGCNNPPLLH